jgi:hypothetical protein
MDYSQDPRVVAIRKDAYINDTVKGTWIVQECYSDEDIVLELDGGAFDREAITTVRGAVKHFRFIESIRRDQRNEIVSTVW